MVGKVRKVLLVSILMGGVVCAENEKNAPAVPEENLKELEVKGIGAIENIQRELEINKRLVSAMEQAVTDAEKKDAQLRSVIKEFNELFPGEGTFWERMARLEDREKSLRELEKFRKKHSYVISKSVVVSSLVAVVTTCAAIFGAKKAGLL